MIVSKSSFSCAGTSGTAPSITSPVPPSIVIWSPSDTTVPSTVNVRASASICRCSAPATQGFPICRATTAACEVMPPRAVSTPCACSTPWMSSGVVSHRTRITACSALPRSSAVSASNTTAPTAAPGEALRPRVSTSRGADGSMAGCSSWSSCPGSTRSSAVGRSITPSSTMSRATRTAAAAVRLPARVCRM